MTSLGRQSVPETSPDSSPHSDLGAMKDQPADGVEIIVELPVPDGNRADQSSVSATLFRFNFDAGGQADADSQAFTIALPTLKQQKVSECWITQGPVLAGQADGSAQNGSRGGQVLDLLTVSVLAQWLARAMPAVGREQLGKLVIIK